MPAGHEQGDVRKRRRVRFEQRRQQVTFQVMDANRRFAPGISQAPGQRGPREKRADQAGACGIGDPVELGRTRFRPIQRGSNERQKAANVVPGSQFRHDSTKNPMQVDLAEELMGEQPFVPVEHGYGAFVAGRFDGQNTHAIRLPQLPLPFAARLI